MRIIYVLNSFYPCNLQNSGAACLNHLDAYANYGEGSIERSSADPG